MKTMTISKNQLVGNQEKRLNAFLKSSKKIAVAKLGASNGCAASRGNYHSTWAIRNGKDAEIVKIMGDPRSAWRIMVKKYGMANVF
jgi:hypothetical protein